MLQDSNKALEYYKIVIRHVNEIIKNGDTSVIRPKICDIYVEYLLIHVENQMDLSSAKEEVEKYYKAVTKDLKMPLSYLLYVMASKSRAKLILKDFDGCLKILRKLLKLVRKFKDELVDPDLLDDPQIFPTEIQILYQIGKGRLLIYIVHRNLEIFLPLRFYVKSMFSMFQFMNS